jgi:hypothetical protein
MIVCAGFTASAIHARISVKTTQYCCSFRPRRPIDVCTPTYDYIGTTAVHASLDANYLLRNNALTIPGGCRLVLGFYQAASECWHPSQESALVPTTHSIRPVLSRLAGDHNHVRGVL